MLAGATIHHHTITIPFITITMNQGHCEPHTCDRLLHACRSNGARIQGLVPCVAGGRGVGWGTLAGTLAVQGPYSAMERRHMICRVGQLCMRQAQATVFPVRLTYIWCVYRVQIQQKIRIWPILCTCMRCCRARRASLPPLPPDFIPSPCPHCCAKRFRAPEATTTLMPNCCISVRVAISMARLHGPLRTPSDSSTTAGDLWYWATQSKPVRS